MALKEGLTEARLEMRARVRLELDGDSFKVIWSDLDLSADVPHLDADKHSLAEDAKNCPISKLVDADIDLTVRAGASAAV